MLSVLVQLTACQDLSLKCPIICHAHPLAVVVILTFSCVFFLGLPTYKSVYSENYCQQKKTILSIHDSF